MVDLVSLIIAIGAVIVSISTHIKYSSCCGFRVETRTPKNSSPSTPHKDEKMPLIPSEPIDIPKKVEPKRVYL